MKRLTTPKLTFELPFDKTIIEKIRLTFKQSDTIIFVKESDQLRWEDNMVTVKLTQAETQQLSPTILQMELHILTTGGDSLKSDPISVCVEDVLNDEVLE